LIFLYKYEMGWNQRVRRVWQHTILIQQREQQPILVSAIGRPTASTAPIPYTTHTRSGIHGVHHIYSITKSFTAPLAQAHELFTPMSCWHFISSAPTLQSVVKLNKRCELNFEALLIVGHPFMHSYCSWKDILPPLYSSATWCASWIVCAPTYQPYGFSLSKCKPRLGWLITFIQHGACLVHRNWACYDRVHPSR
jgi:hypothetical protein